MVQTPRSAMPRTERMSRKRDSIVSGSIRSGNSPHRPSRMAPSVPWPRPVSASDPYNSTSTRWVRINRSLLARIATKSEAARIGPTVWELDGPIHTLKISKMLVFTDCLLSCFERPVSGTADDSPIARLGDRAGPPIELRSTFPPLSWPAGTAASNPGRPPWSRSLTC